MPKKTKLNLSGLKIRSFVTSIETPDESKIKGGVKYTMYVSCSCMTDCPTWFDCSATTCPTNHTECCP